ncbi:MAG: M48 family metallopeptidase [Chitinophagaceae bacterium]|nr:M48 family metallopeptidase [Chitinophagaceae bacterium]
MKKIFCLLLVGIVLISCERNAITGRNQLSLVPESEVQSMALAQYSEFLSTNKVVQPTASNNAAMVKRVGNNLINAINQYYQKNNLSSELSGYKWEINLVEDKNINAWCMPGGKIVVYTGLLPVTQNENALAIVMGHEIAHALAKHGSERMSQGLVQQLGGIALSVAIQDKPQQTQNLFMSAYGIGSNLGYVLPFSRSNELEADKFGLMFAALANYDPREAIPFWQRMSQQGGTKPPEFLSTHPSDEKRIAELKTLVPEIMKNYYNPVH